MPELFVSYPKGEFLLFLCMFCYELLLQFVRHQLV